MARRIINCAHPGCGPKPHKGRGLCGNHYYHWRMEQRANGGVKRKTPQERLDAKTDKSSGPNACWIWNGVKNNKGYGLIEVDRRDRLTHRTSFLLAYGPFDERLSVCHACDTPACVNPSHLFLGTHKDNMQDMWSKGRGRAAPRKTHCIRGHEYTPENMKKTSRGHNSCRICCNKLRQERRRNGGKN